MAGGYPIRTGVAAALATADKQQATPDSLTMRALRAAVEANGHGTLLWDSAAPQETKPKKPEASTRTLDHVRIVVLPELAPGDYLTTGNCNHVAELVDPANAPPVHALILDLRGNEGGMLPIAECVARLFRKAGETLFTVDSHQDEPEVFGARSWAGPINQLPMVVLIDRGTDSGGLLLAASLQHIGRAKLVGEAKESGDIHGDVHSLFIVRGTNLRIKLPFGRLMVGKDRPLTAGVRVDAPAPAGDDSALLKTARAVLETP